MQAAVDLFLLQCVNSLLFMIIIIGITYLPDQHVVLYKNYFEGRAKRKFEVLHFNSIFFSSTNQQINNSFIHSEKLFAWSF